MTHDFIQVAFDFIYNQTKQFNICTFDNQKPKDFYELSKIEYIELISACERVIRFRDDNIVKSRK